VTDEDNCFEFEDGLVANDYEPGSGLDGIVCFSGGKDSTAMLIRMLELDDPVNYPVNRVVFADTTFEFQELYDYIDFIDGWLQEHYPKCPRIEKVFSEKSWEDWFYGEITRGENKGRIRGHPLKRYPCWWSREAKIKPLQKAQQGFKWAYVGIAVDESHRVQKRDAKRKESLRVRYPLIEWNWTEADCMAYLDHLGLGNLLYSSFNRIGCYHCPKQPLHSWYEVWKHWPEFWKESLHWDAESIRVRDNGQGLRDDMTLAEMEERFKNGFVPENRDGLYDCKSCSAVSFHSTGDLDLEDFDDDNAIERDVGYQGSRIHQDQAKQDSDEATWIPPSHETTNVEWL